MLIKWWFLEFLPIRLIYMVWDLLEVFHADLLDMTPDCDIDFWITFKLDTLPTSIC